MKIDLIIPAAGFASRFPVNKLLYSLHGKCILEHVLDVVEQLDFHAIYVVTQYPEIKQPLSKRKAVCVWNPQPQKGLSSSLLVGLQECKDADAVMFLNGDMPYIKKESLVRMMVLASDEHIVCGRYQGMIQNPMLFPICYREELERLSGDWGAKGIALYHLESCRFVELSEKEVCDVDTLADIYEN